MMLWKVFRETLSSSTGTFEEISIKGIPIKCNNNIYQLRTSNICYFLTISNFFHAREGHITKQSIPNMETHDYHHRCTNIITLLNKSETQLATTTYVNAKRNIECGTLGGL